MLQHVLSHMHERVARLKKDQIEEAMNTILQFVYDERNMFDGYDIPGYVQVYVQEMELQQESENCMIDAFKNLVVPEISECVQKIQAEHGEYLVDFQRALKH